MQFALGSIAVLFVLACVVYVIGHQLGAASFDPARYTVLRGVLPLAYVVAALTVAVIVASIVATVFKK